jgi:hypothetical protein
LSTVQQKISGGPTVGIERKDQGIRQSGRASSLFFRLLSAPVRHVFFCFPPENTCKKNIQKSHILLSEGGAGKGD